MKTAKKTFQERKEQIIKWKKYATDDLTTDDKVIKKACALTDIKISDPIDFIKKVFP